jgi:hypothetical protein
VSSGARSLFAELEESKARQAELRAAAAEANGELTDTKSDLAEAKQAVWSTKFERKAQVKSIASEKRGRELAETKLKKECAAWKTEKAGYEAEAGKKRRLIDAANKRREGVEAEREWNRGASARGRSERKFGRLSVACLLLLLASERTRAKRAQEGEAFGRLPAASARSARTKEGDVLAPRARAGCWRRSWCTAAASPFAIASFSRWVGGGHTDYLTPSPLTPQPTPPPLTVLDAKREREGEKDSHELNVAALEKKLKLHLGAAAKGKEELEKKLAGSEGDIEVLEHNHKTAVAGLKKKMKLQRDELMQAIKVRRPASGSGRQNFRFANPCPAQDKNAVDKIWSGQIKAKNEALSAAEERADDAEEAAEAAEKAALDAGRSYAEALRKVEGVWAEQVRVVRGKQEEALRKGRGLMEQAEELRGRVAKAEDLRDALQSSLVEATKQKQKAEAELLEAKGAGAGAEEEEDYDIFL